MRRGGQRVASDLQVHERDSVRRARWRIAGTLLCLLTSTAAQLFLAIWALQTRGAYSFRCSGVVPACLFRWDRLSRKRFAQALEGVYAVPVGSSASAAFCLAPLLLAAGTVTARTAELA